MQSVQQKKDCDFHPTPIENDKHLHSDGVLLQDINLLVLHPNRGVLNCQLVFIMLVTLLKSTVTANYCYSLQFPHLSPPVNRRDQRYP